MADIFGVSPPAWLQDLTRSNDKGLLGGILGELAASPLIAMIQVSDDIKKQQAQGRTEGFGFGERASMWLHDLPQSIAEAHLNVLDPMWKLKVQQSQLKIAETGLALQEMQQKVALNASNLQMRAEDTKEIPKWLAEHPTYESRRDAEWPSARTPEWNNNLNQLRLRDSQSEQAKVAVAGVKAFTDRLSALSKDDPAAAAQVASAAQQYTAKGQAPPPAVTQALAQAEQAVMQRKTDLETQRQAQIARAAAEAEAAGGTVQRSFGPKGDVITIKPAPVVAGHPLGEVIPVLDPTTKAPLGNVVVTGPNTGRFEKNESAQGAGKPGSLSAVQKQRIKDIDLEAKKIADQLPPSPPSKGFFTSQAKVDAYNKATSRLEELRAQKEAILTGAPQGTQPAPTTPNAAVVQETPAKPASKAEFDALPRGSLFVNPSDGKLYRKK